MYVDTQCIQLLQSTYTVGWKNEVCEASDLGLTKAFSPGDSRLQIVLDLFITLFYASKQIENSGLLMVYSGRFPLMFGH